MTTKHEVRLKPRGERRPIQVFFEDTGFDVERKVPGAMYVDYLDALAIFREKGEENLGADDISNITRLCKHVYATIMSEAEFNRFWTWARGKDGPDISMLLQGIGGLANVSDADRPTEQPSSSGSGQETTGTTSGES